MTIGGAVTFRYGARIMEGDKFTLGDGGVATMRTGGAISGVGGGQKMDWSKMIGRSVMIRNWELPSLAKGAAGAGWERALATERAVTTAAAEKNILGIRQEAGEIAQSWWFACHRWQVFTPGSTGSSPWRRPSSNHWCHGETICAAGMVFCTPGPSCQEDWGAFGSSQRLRLPRPQWKVMGLFETVRGGWS